MAGVVDELAVRLVLRHRRDLDAAGRNSRAAHGRVELGAEAGALGGRLKHDLLAAVRLAVGAAGRLRVGEVLRRDVHPQALRGERRRGDLHAAEHAHQPTPMAERRIMIRVLATDTAASWSSALAASLADSESMSIE